MDPDATLARIRNLVGAIDSAAGRTEDLAGYAEELAEHVEALDSWIVAGGALPTGWRTIIRTFNREGAR